MGKKQVAIATRYDRALAKEENATIARVNTRLEQAYGQINGELTTYYENLQSEGSLSAQMQVRRSEELKAVLTRIDPSRGAQYEREFEQLITTATQTGRTLGDELLKSYQSDLVGQFSNIPYEAIAAQARDGAIRLSKHTAVFQDKASAVIEMGLVQGQSSKWMEKKLRDQLGVTKSKAESIARTESASAFNTAAQARYKSGGAEGVQVITTPSDRVCPFCAARNGNVYKNGAISVPFHVRCRCVILPHSPDWQRLGLTDDEFIKDYREKGLKELRSLGLQPDFGLAPFEKANKLKNVPVAIWKPGDAVLKPVKKTVAPKPKTKPEPIQPDPTGPSPEELERQAAIERANQLSLERARRREEEDAARQLAQKSAALEKSPEGFKAFIELGKKENSEFYTDFEKTKNRINAGLDKKYNELVAARKLHWADPSNLSLKKAFLKAERANMMAEEAVNDQLNAPFKRLRDRLIGRGDESSARLWASFKLKVDDSAQEIRNSWQMRDELKEFHQITRGKVSKSLDTLMFDNNRPSADRDRAYANRFARSINIGIQETDREAKTVLFHEAGHHVEYSSDRVFRAVDGWMFNRAESSTPYVASNGESYLRGDFLDQYVSRIYYDAGTTNRRNSTEVTSMGLQQFAHVEDMKNLYAKDREMFDLMLGILASD